DRQANAVPHRIVFARLSLDPRTQAYCERRTQEGKTRRETIRQNGRVRYVPPGGQLPGHGNPFAVGT
ncbi:hypothetical protein ACFPN6_13020, partial [Streptomyces fimbriatus]